MDSDNPIGADNQQERLDAYLAGFVDGEGTFHVAIQRNPSTTSWMAARAGVPRQPEPGAAGGPRPPSAPARLRTHPGEPSWFSRHDPRVGRAQPEGSRGAGHPLLRSQPLLSAKQDEFLAFRSIVDHDGGGRAPAIGRLRGAQGEGPHHERWRAVSPSAPKRRHSRILRGHMPNTGAHPVKIWSDLHGDM